ncbi:MAG: calcineurin-like phosphoesterase family protein [Rikenellaceae bacterium]|jgi:hypothetical protein|nr:calcineurin-like phosphoesterase family protein [Rikenellaceae bacterium]
MKPLRFLLRGFALIAALTFALTACKDDRPTDPTVAVQGMIKDFMLPTPLSLYDGQPIEVQGKGFRTGDLLRLVDASGSEIILTLTSCDAASALFSPIATVVSGEYTIALVRAGRIETFGKYVVRKTINAQIPDRTGATVKGMVYCDGQPLAGVGVSDGVDIVLTDADGCYWLDSNKEQKHVFVIIPSGYEPSFISSLPDMWAPLTAPAGEVEQHNFELFQVNNTKHVVLMTADLHLASRTTTNDQWRYFNNFIPDVELFANSLASYGKVYTLCLGDMTWDLYWYSNRYSIADYKASLSRYPTPIFHTMGNHDNDPAVSNNDRGAEEQYRKELGPTYYSFNLGQVHYIVVDNIVYRNTGTGDPANNVAGDRSYTASVTQNQLDWIVKDLALVADKSAPIVIAGHIPFYSINSTTFAVSRGSYVSALENLLTGEGFTNINFFSGHLHNNKTMTFSPAIREHNVAAVCSTWWWTEAISNDHICTDGSPGGYKVFTVDGRNLSWQYKPMGGGVDSQFRAYDMNRVKQYFGANADAVAYLNTNVAMKSAIQSVPDNVALINIWGWDTGWSLTVRENGATLPYTRKTTYDPLHAISYSVPRYKAAGSLTFPTELTTHMFLVQSATADGTLEIEVRDNFGNIYRETMVRPKNFNLAIQ